MKTYKFLAVALVATGIFSACTNEVVVQPVNLSDPAEIAFHLQGGMPEATYATATTTLNVDAFAVYGIDDVANTGTGDNILQGVTVARQVVGGGFDYNPKKYFSDGVANAQFFAYSPVSARKDITNLPTASVFGGASFDYKVVIPDNSGNTTQEDLLVAGTSFTFNPSLPATPVNLVFTHALSRIFVKATNALSQDVVITGLTLKALHSEGTITGSTAAPWTWAWSAQQTPIDYDYILASTGVAVKAGTGFGTAPNDEPILVTSMEQGMMIIPQATAANNGDDVYNAGEFALEVTYDIANRIGEKKYVFFATPYTFAYNNQYAITIAFSGTDQIEINFTISVSPFGTPITNLP